MSDQIVATGRKITVFQTRGNKSVVIETDSKTFGQLKSLFRKHGVEYTPEGMVAIENVANSTLDLDMAILPEGDFMLGIFPRKTKAGAGERSILYARIKEFIAASGKEAVNAYFKKATGKHYTNISTDELQGLVDNYNGNVPVAVAPAKKPTKKPNQGEVQSEQILELLKQAGISSDVLNRVQNELIEPIYVDMEWVSLICERHPQIRC